MTIKYACLVDNRAGDVYDVPFIKVEISAKYNGEPAKCSFSYLRKSGAAIEPGNVVRFDVDGATIFYGYVVQVKPTEKEDVQCVAYDQMFYLRYKDTYTFKAQTATQIISKVCGDAGLNMGDLEDTGHPINLLSEDKKYCEMIQDALDRTVAEMQKWYLIRDEAGKVCLRSLDSLKVDLIVGEWALATGYDYEQSIESDTYNKIKLVKKDEKKGTREVYIFNNSDTQAKWGTLQFYQTVDEGLSEGEIKQKGEMLLKTKNRVLRKLAITNAIGDPQALAGSVIFVNLPEIGIATWFVIAESTHTFINEVHTMKLTLHMPNIQEGA